MEKIEIVKECVRFAERLEPKTEPTKEQPKRYMDKNNIMMVIPRTPEVINVLKNYEETESKEPKLEYDNNTATYNREYFKDILKLLTKNKSDTIKLSVKKDYPLTIENEDFKIILAPRIDTE